MIDAESNGPERLYTVGEVSDLVGLSVRALHHWEHEGVAAPSTRSASGYRLYSRADVARIQHALVYRETGMPLARIAEALDAPDSPLDHLIRQRALLTERISRLKAMLGAVDALINAKETRMTTPEYDAKVLGSDWSEDPYEGEARERWGTSAQWEQAQRTRAERGPEGEAAAAARLARVEAELAAAFREGAEPGSARANELAEQHRRALDWYEVTPARHVILSRMYREDPRFRARYEELSPGLAQWLGSVIEENARALGLDPATAAWD
ncbi:MerR family transcriptional regulator [Schaalia hyovaginalis]|uniref:MerR family transcriptional regulator n=1 Tax=Schaalia hyovaginalis TaxID=29316 RepID=UPI0023F78839|nr:MerR family transcriptional regulator [Schaalia hyovaginalis]MCI7671792.1 MerR family transcriptional regulator [Schaalia hyovaginalis]